MAEPLPTEIDAQVARLFDEAEELLDGGEDDEALARFQAAWELIPEPKGEWQRAQQVLGGIAECHFFLCDYEACIQSLQGGFRAGVVGPANPWVCLRLGQCYLQLGSEGPAGNWLTSALMGGGTELFADEDEDYREFLKSKPHPPPGGWPAGW